MTSRAVTNATTVLRTCYQREDMTIKEPIR